MSEMPPDDLAPLIRELQEAVYLGGVEVLDRVSQKIWPDGDVLGRITPTAGNCCDDAPVDPKAVMAAVKLVRERALVPDSPQL